MTDISVLSITNAQFIVLLIVFFATLFTILLVHFWIFKEFQKLVIDIKQIVNDKQNEIYKDSMKNLKEMFRIKWNQIKEYE